MVASGLPGLRHAIQCVCVCVGNGTQEENLLERRGHSLLQLVGGEEAETKLVCSEGEGRVPDCPVQG